MCKEFEDYILKLIGDYSGDGSKRLRIRTTKRRHFGRIYVVTVHQDAVVERRWLKKSMWMLVTDRIVLRLMGVLVSQERIVGNHICCKHMNKQINICANELIHDYKLML
jgi:hypothetical protein